MGKGPAYSWASRIVGMQFAISGIGTSLPYCRGARDSSFQTSSRPWADVPRTGAVDPGRTRHCVASDLAFGGLSAPSRLGNGRNRSLAGRLTQSQSIDRRIASMTESMYEKGLANRKAVLGAEYVEKSIQGADDFNRPLQELVTTYCWGEIWGRE